MTIYSLDVLLFLFGTSMVLHFFKCENSTVRPEGFYGGLLQKWLPISSKLLVPMLLPISFHIHFGFNHVFGFDQWDNSWCDSSKSEHCFHIWDYPHLPHFKPWHVSKSKPACQRMGNIPGCHSDTECFSQQPTHHQVIWLWSDHAGPTRCLSNLLTVSTCVMQNENSQFQLRLVELPIRFLS